MPIELALFRTRRALWQHLGINDPSALSPRDLADALTIIGAEEAHAQMLRAVEKAGAERKA